MNSTAINIWVQISFQQTNFITYISMYLIVGLLVHSIVLILIICNTITPFSTMTTNLQIHPQCTWFPFLHQHLLPLQILMWKWKNSALEAPLGSERNTFPAPEPEICRFWGAELPPLAQPARQVRFQLRHPECKSIRWEIKCLSHVMGSQIAPLTPSTHHSKPLSDLECSQATWGRKRHYKFCKSRGEC